LEKGRSHRSQIRGVRWVGMTAILYFARNCWVRKEVWDGALSR
jgi:hypothetical protein